MQRGECGGGGGGKHRNDQQTPGDEELVLCEEENKKDAQQKGAMKIASSGLNSGQESDSRLIAARGRPGGPAVGALEARVVVVLGLLGFGK